ncbi:MAG: IS1595 family transposase [Methyloceanibacter sp.]
MGKNTFASKHFHDEDAARAWFEKARWPNGPVCPNCESTKHYATKKVGRYRCANRECRKDFTVMTKSVMERSHEPLTHWAVAFHMAASGKKGFSAHQLHRELGCQYNTAWFLHHRVMEAMRRGGLEPPLGGEGKIVEADETYFGEVEEHRIPTLKRKIPGRSFARRGPHHKRAIVALVERGGNVRTFHVASADKATVGSIVAENIDRETRLHTDESRLYLEVGALFKAHETVKHSAKEYVRGDVHTNASENYFSIFKRGMRGVYQHCKEKNLHRYLAEFDFRYNTRKMTDGEHAVLAVKAGEGKRLTYRQPH